MITYKDKTFCSITDDCATIDYDKRFTIYDQERAEDWFGVRNPPISFSDMSSECGKYKPIKENKCVR